MIQPVKNIFTNWRNPQHKNEYPVLSYLANIEADTRWGFEFFGSGNVKVTFAVHETGAEQYFPAGEWIFAALPTMEENQVDFHTNAIKVEIFTLNEDDKKTILYKYPA